MYLYVPEENNGSYTLLGLVYVAFRTNAPFWFKVDSDSIELDKEHAMGTQVAKLQNLD